MTKSTLKGFAFSTALLVAAVFAGCSSSTDAPQTNRGLLRAPAVMDFGIVRQGDCKDTAMLLTNTGSAEVTITSHSFSSSIFTLADSSSQSIKIPSGEARGVMVRYCPLDTNKITASDTIRSNSKDGNVVVVLQGGSFARTRTLVGPGLVEFGELAVGRCRDTVLQLTNDGNDVLRIDSSMIVGETASFSIVNATYPIVIAPGASTSLAIHFCPSAAQSFTSRDSIVSNATNGVTGIILHGTGRPFTVGATSSFNYSGFATDSLGNKRQGTDFVSTAIIDASGIAHAGRTNVIRVREGADTTYYNYEPNGNVSIWTNPLALGDANSVGGGWIELPTATHETGRQVLKYDSTVTGGVIQVRETVDYLGEEIVTVSGQESLNTSRVRITVTIAFVTQVRTFPLTRTINAWYAPKIGFSAQTAEHTLNMIPTINTRSGGSFKILTSYTLK